MSAHGLTFPDNRDKPLELVRISGLMIPVFPVRAGRFDIGEEPLDQRLNRLAVELEAPFEVLLELGGKATDVDACETSDAA